MEQIGLDFLVGKTPVEKINHKGGEAMQTDVRIRNFRVEIVKRINGIYPLLERGDSDYKSVLVQCLKIVDIEINKNPLSL